MTEQTLTDRRTVLKTIPAAAIGTSLLAGVASAGRGKSQGAARSRENLVEIVSEHDHHDGEHAFDFSTTEVPSGWVTLHLDNRTEHTHFVYLAKLPLAAIDDAGEEDLLDFYVETVTRPFQFYMDLLTPGKEPDPADLSDRYASLFPPWFGEVLSSGGVGLTSPYASATSTIHLDPGQYVAECYVKDGDADFHSYLGMIELLTVTDDRVGNEPRPTATLSLSTGGIEFPDAVRPGRHTVAVEFEDQQIYEHLIGHDAHLVRLDGGTTVADLDAWMDWRAVGGLVSDGSEPGEFLGGVDTIVTPELLAGTGTETGYCHVTLTPGDYAWVAEVPTPSSKGLVEAFTVPAA